MIDCSCPSCRANRATAQYRPQPETFEYEFESIADTPPTAPKPCPPQAKVIDCPPRGKPALVLDDFPFDSGAITTVNRPRIHALVKDILAAESGIAPVRRIRIVGHTDRVGTHDYNLALGRARARGIAMALCSQLEHKARGIMKNITVQISSCGARQPRSTPEASRRVEIFLQVVRKPLGRTPLTP